MSASGGTRRASQIDHIGATAYLADLGRAAEQIGGYARVDRKVDCLGHDYAGT
jgi:hypothetical protein